MSEAGWRAFARPGRLWLAAGLLLHALLVLQRFPPSMGLSGQWLLEGDLSYHAASAAEGVPFLRDQHRLWGYSPADMAGHPWGTWGSSSRRGYELAAALMPFVTPPRAFYLYLVGTAMLIPLVLLAACRLAGLRGKTLQATGWLALIAVHLDSRVAYFWTIGNVAFVFTSALAVLCAALLWRALECSWSAAVGGGLLVGAVVWVHPLSVVPLACGTAAVLAAGRRRLRGPAACRLALTAALAVAVLWPLLRVLLPWHSVLVPVPTGTLMTGPKYLAFDLLNDRAYGQPFDRRIVFQAFFVLASIGAWRGGGIARVFGCAALGAYGLAHGFGTSATGRALEPDRFAISAMLLALPAAATGWQLASGWWAAASADGRRVTAVVGALLLPGLCGCLVEAVDRQPIRPVPSEERAAVEWLRANTPAGGRILCDTREMGNVAQVLTGRPVVGTGNSAIYPLAFGFCSVQSAHLTASGRELLTFGRPTAELTADDWRRYLALYGVRAAAAESEEVKHGLASCPDTARLVRVCGAVSLYEVHPPALPGLWPGSFDGRVTAGPNRITIDDAPPGRFVIGFHWIPTLQAEGVTLSPQPMLDDPVPFIAVHNVQGLRRIEITNIYRWPDSGPGL